MFKVYSTHNGDDTKVETLVNTTFFRVFSATFPPQLAPVGGGPSATCREDRKGLVQKHGHRSFEWWLCPGLPQGDSENFRAGVVNMCVKWWNLTMSVQFLFGKWGMYNLRTRLHQLRYGKMADLDRVDFSWRCTTINLRNMAMAQTCCNMEYTWNHKIGTSFEWSHPS